MRLLDLPWRPLRAASTTEWAASFATDGATCVHRWQREGFEPLYLVSQSGWAPGDVPVRTRFGGFEDLPGMPPVMPARFQWCSRLAREGPMQPSGFAPWMVSTDPGEQGGGGIELHPRAECTEARADSIADRTPFAAFHRGSGLPLTRRFLGSWFEYRLDRLPSYSDPEIQRLPQFRRSASDGAISTWEGADEYHLVRAFMEDLGLWRQKRCPIARWRVLMVAEDARLAYTLDGKKQDAGSSWVPLSLSSMLAHAMARPATGGRIVRGVAWVLRAFAAALEVGTPNASEFRTHIAALLKYIQLVQLPSGAFYDARYGYSMDQDEPVYMFDLDPRYGWAPSWQVPFLVRAVWEAQRVMPEMRRRAIGIVQNAERMWTTGPRVADEYGGAPGLPRYVVTSVDGVPVPAITSGVGPARSQYDADAFQVFDEARSP